MSRKGAFALVTKLNNWIIFGHCKIFEGNCLIFKVYTALLGAWIAERSSHSTYKRWYAMPWTESSSLGDEKLFFGPKNNIYALFMILFGLFDTIICLSNLSCELWNRKLKLKKRYLKKNSSSPTFVAAKSYFVNACKHMKRERWSVHHFHRIEGLRWTPGAVSRRR